MKFGLKAFVLTSVALLGSPSFAAEFRRWTYVEQSAGDLTTVLQELSQRTGWEFTAADFKLVEDRDLAFSHYKRLVQMRRQRGMTEPVLKRKRNALALPAIELLQATCERAGLSRPRELLERSRRVIVHVLDYQVVI